MDTIGNSLAFGILILISIVFFRTKYYLTKASKYYRISLLLSFLTAIISTARLETVRLSTTPEWLVVGITTVEFFIVFILTSIMTFYLASKITEHILEENTLRPAKIVLVANASVFSLAVIINIRYRYIFDVVDGSFVNGPLAFLPYLIIIPQFILVALYCLQYRKTLNQKILFALIESVFIIGFCLGAKFIYDVSVLAFTLSLIQLVFLLDFQRQKMGVNSVTKLNDGRSFFSELEKRIKKDSDFKVYLIWIENFRIIKQNYGQKIGDEALYRFASSLDRLFLNSSAFHMYGTNFTLIVDNKSSDINYTDKLLEFLDAGLTIDKKELKLDYIVAEHTWMQDEPNTDAFYEKLEYAASIAKENHNRFITYTLDLEIARLRKKYLINRMQKVSSEEGFEIWFQPIFSNSQNGFFSAEVLLRLKEKNGSFISPAEFIPIAEKTGQINAITWFVIEETCRALSEIAEFDGIRASINLPMLHLVDPSFEDRLNKIVDKYKISHDRISFEFTERVILDDLDVAEKNMCRLTKSGYSFYLDDFGVGYSNFNCVLRLPLKTVKLDMTLTATAETLEKNHNLVCILTDLFHDMGLTVTAEGAETYEQIELLREYGVDNIQGYYYAKPMPVKKAAEFFKNNK